MRVTPFAGAFLGITFVAATSAFAQTERRQPDSTITAPAPGGTMAPPATTRPGGRGSTNVRPGSQIVRELTTTECKQLGGESTVVRTSICKSGRLCTTTDQDGTLHSACITRR
jgi:hypothetical protein